MKPHLILVLGLVAGCGSALTSEDPFDWDSFSGSGDVTSPDRGAVGFPRTGRVFLLDAVAADDFNVSGELFLSALVVVGGSGDERAPGAGSRTLPPSSVNITACANSEDIACDGPDETPLSSSFDKAVPPRVRTNNMPFAVGILIDSSGSMGWTDPNRLRVDGGHDYIDLVHELEPDSEFSVADFGAGSTTGFTNTRLLSEFTNDIEQAKDAVEQTVASGGTPLYESAYEYLDYINDEASDQDYERAMLLMSDGDPNNRNLEDDVIDRALDYNIPINTLVLNNGDTSLNVVPRMLARETGGVFSAAASAEDLEFAFQGSAFGNELGYGVYLLKFPDGTRPTSAIRIAASAGGPASTILFDPNN